jgi:multidrug efflux pump subunit AcrA (membrane-fusion protein)
MLGRYHAWFRLKEHGNIASLQECHGCNTDFSMNSNPTQLTSRALKEPLESRSESRSELPSRRRWLPWFWGLVCVAAFFAGRYIQTEGQSSHSRLALHPSDVAKHSADAVVVTAIPVESRTIERTVEAVGTLFGFEEVDISSKLDGRVVRIHSDLSSVVKPGDVLLELDSTDARLALEQAERSLNAELAKWGFESVPDGTYDRNLLPMVVSARLRFDLARSRLERMLPLEQTRSISADDLEQAKSEARIAESEWKNQLLLANSAAANARLKAADVQVAMQRLSDCQILVPTPTLTENAQPPMYTVSERMVSEGTNVRPGTVVFRLVLGRTLKLRLSIPEAYASSVALNQQVMVSTSASSESQFGTVAKISPSIDRATRTFVVEVEVPNADGKCKPGSFAKARILVGRTDNALTVPLGALYSAAGINKIFVVDGEQVREVRVRVGDQSSDWIEIAEPPLAPDAWVVTSGQRLLADGTRIALRSMASQGGDQAPQEASRQR